MLHSFVPIKNIKILVKSMEIICYYCIIQIKTENINKLTKMAHLISHIDVWITTTAVVTGWMTEHHSLELGGPDTGQTGAVSRHSPQHCLSK